MDKVCAVFGGSRGIGRAVAQLMAQKGYRLAIIARNLEVAKAAAGDLGGRYRTGVQLCGCSPRDLSLICKISGFDLHDSAIWQFSRLQAGARCLECRLQLGQTSYRRVSPRVPPATLPTSQHVGIFFAT